MRVLIAVFLLTTLAAAQAPAIQKPKLRNCESSASLLYQPVLHTIWQHDEEGALGDGFIRIAIHPAWDPEIFADIGLNRTGSPTIVLYSLPEGVKTLTKVIERALKNSPCVDPTTLAAMLSIHRRKVPANKKIDELVTQFFAIHWGPRRISDLVRLDATEYELEFFGDDTIRFRSDDYETPIVKWIDSFFSAANEAVEKR